MDSKTAVPLTTFDVSRYLHVDLTTVINWCDQGKLPSYKTPGGHRRVEPEKFMEFLKTFKLPIPPEFRERVHGGLRILIVDDETYVRRVLSKAFAKSLPEAKVYEAADGFEAGKMTLDILPDLVVLDLKLPGIDGFKVCASIRADDRFKHTRILAVTGQDTQENKSKILHAGADDYLPKPFEVKILNEKVFRLLEISREVPVR